MSLATMAILRQALSIDDDEIAVSQNLIDAALEGDEMAVDKALANAVVDVNYMGTVSLITKRTDAIQQDESSDVLKVDYVQFKTDVTALFAACHSGHLDIVRKLLKAGADVNQRLFRGFATTAATREGHYEVLYTLLRAGASQPACEEALLEACLSGQVKVAELLINWEMSRPEILTTALVHASSRGLLGIVELLIKVGVNANSWSRVLLRSKRPVLHASVNCTALIAAVVCRQATVVEYLLQAGASLHCEARLGAWSWDINSGEVLRVGAGMAEPYNAVWCAIEYWEVHGKILSLLLEHISANDERQGRSLLCHAVLCGNTHATEMLLQAGAQVGYCVHTKDGGEFRPIHLAVKRGFLPIVKKLISWDCDLNARTEGGETALMLCAMLENQECFCELVISGADFGLINKAGQNVIDIAEASNCGHLFHEIILDCILAGKLPYSSDRQIFSPLHFVAHHGRAKVMRELFRYTDLDLNQQDKFGFTPIMNAAQVGNMEVFKVLLFAGAHIGVKNVEGENAVMLAEASGNKDQCERLLFEAIMENLLGGDFKALHFAAKRGNLEVLNHVLKFGSAMNEFDDDGYTALMLSVKEGHVDACKLLLSQGADCYLVNSRGETALTLSRRNSFTRVVEGVLLDHMARQLVLAGGELSKHTRQGKGRPHMKFVKMLKSGILKWGDSKRRNVHCKEVSVGCSPKFLRNRKNRDIRKDGLFRVVTISGKEVHFDADAAFTAELWVRGIILTSKEALASSIACNR